jgi:serine-type D-Ala-D-Ala carboxypeptidase (penicillin-binding protein 5/6)
VQDPRGGRLSRLSAGRCGRALLATVAAVALLPAGGARAQSSTKAPDLSARQWILLDTRDHARLAGHEISTSNAMASTTKLMTAYLALHRLPLEKLVTAPAYHPIAGESLLGLEAGERVTVRDLLYGLLLPSGNDAALALADGVAGSEQAFVGEMNREARRLGLDDTSYANPIGLDASTNYTSPRDLADLTLALRRDELFRKIVDTPQITLETGDHPRTITNRNTLLMAHSWVNGVKTGYTPEAGNVLVATGTRKGVTLLSVVMGEPTEADRDGDSLALLDYGFSLYRHEDALKRGERVGSADVPNADDRVSLVAARPVEATVRDGQSIDVALRAPAAVEAPIHRGERLGSATVTVDGKPVGSVPAIAARPVSPAAGGVVASVDDAIPGPRVVVWLLVVAAAAFVILIAAALVGRRQG